jgi:restriction endonuclease Mrr
VYNDNFLKHYGILGMHWGRRKSSGSASGATVIRTRNSEDHDKTVALKQKKLSELTNEELKTYTQRMNLEKQYKELSKADISPGKKFVKDFIGNQAKSALNQIATAQTKKLVDEILKKTAKAAS